jgi:predicted nucleic acid-binding protein
MAADGVAFVDTSVLVDAHDRSQTRKQPVAQAVLEALWRARTGTLSTQVLQACDAVATRKFDPPMRHAAARELVALYRDLPIVHVEVAAHPGRIRARGAQSFTSAPTLEVARQSLARRIACPISRSQHRRCGGGG